MLVLGQQGGEAGGGYGVAGVLGGQFGGEPLEDLDVVAAGITLAVLPQRLGIPAVEDGVAQHGPLMFHQSGGCCDGSSPMCYPAGEFRTGPSDVHLGDLDIPGIAAPIGVWMSASQFAYWSHTHLTIDIVPGRGFSLEAPEGVRFLIRSRLFTEEELAAANS